MRPPLITTSRCPIMSLPHTKTVRTKLQTAEYTIHGSEPSEVTTFGAQDCHHCPHKSMLLDACGRLHTPAASGLWLSALTTTNRIQFSCIWAQGSAQGLSLSGAQSLWLWNGRRYNCLWRSRSLTWCMHSSPGDLIMIQAQTEGVWGGAWDHPTPILTSPLMVLAWDSS
jgi:hypothetical protein